MRRISRRDLIKATALGATALSAGAFKAPTPVKLGQAPFLRNNKLSKKVIALGMDGMDPNLLKRFMAEGIMPTFAKLVKQMHFGELQTTMPPHSPVAWSSFITGTNPGGHGIFDFVHRDPKSFTPYMSTSRTFGSSSQIKLGKWSVPLGSGEVQLMRRGKAFWSILEENGVPASVYAIPANFPVVPGNSQTISGMGTPDLLGSYGTFTYFTDAVVPGAEDFAGGRVVNVKLKDHAVTAQLTGPKNAFSAEGAATSLDLTIERDPWEQVLRLKIDDKTLVLKRGEWSEWLPIKFPLLSVFSGISGMVRFYVKEVHPHLRLYCSPINIDPADPTLPICSPDGYSKELTQAVGRFYTQGFPSDTKALSTGVLSDDEYLVQAKSVLSESLRLFNYQFDRFKDGFFFFYFSSVDQNCHMLWRSMFPDHPLYDPNMSPEVKNAVRFFYTEMDKVLAQTLSKVDENTSLFVLSDHGFAPFTREFHISSWLAENGFLTLSDPTKRGEGSFYEYVDWSKTRVYALGINGLYLNLRGREPNGIVDPSKADDVLSELIAKLSNVRDPASNAPMLTKVYRPQEIYSGAFVNLAPDLIVGYRSGYRISDEAVLGKFPKGIVGDRVDKWSADHCLDPAVVPGILLTNRGCSLERPGLWDLAPSILSAFSMQSGSEMTGRSILS